MVGTFGHEGFQAVVAVKQQWVWNLVVFDCTGNKDRMADTGDYDRQAVVAEKHQWVLRQASAGCRNGRMAGTVQLEISQDVMYQVSWLIFDVAKDGNGVLEILNAVGKKMGEEVSVLGL